MFTPQPRRWWAATYAGTVEQPRDVVVFTDLTREQIIRLTELVRAHPAISHDLDEQEPRPNRRLLRWLEHVAYQQRPGRHAPTHWPTNPPRGGTHVHHRHQ